MATDCEVIIDYTKAKISQEDIDLFKKIKNETNVFLVLTKSQKIYQDHTNTQIFAQTQGIKKNMSVSCNTIQDGLNFLHHEKIDYIFVTPNTINEAKEMDFMMKKWPNTKKLCQIVFDCGNYDVYKIATDVSITSNNFV